jgi:hypothetical protein
VVTERAELVRLAGEKEAENLEFRRYLKAHPALETLFGETALAVEAQIDCTQCAACCRETKVNVNAGEIEAIARHLGSEVAQVIHEYTELDPVDHERMLRQPDGGCVFLDGKLCMVYEARPRACRDFPYLGVHECSLGSRMASIWSHAWFCPIVYNSIEAHKKRVGFTKRAPGS